jgi:hypothetical protein
MSNEDTMHVNLQLANGNRVDAVIRVEDSDRVFTTWTDANDNPNPQR